MSEDSGVELFAPDERKYEEEARELRQSLRNVAMGSWFSGVLALFTTGAALLFYLTATDVIELV